MLPEWHHASCGPTVQVGVAVGTAARTWARYFRYNRFPES